MSESFADRLSRLTPTGNGLDRDSLLFAAGHASARPNRRWVVLCSALATSQLLSLGLLLWPSPPAPPGNSPERLPIVHNDKPTQPMRNESPTWEPRPQTIASNEDPASSAIVEHLVPAAPPLHAFGEPPASLTE